jgi:single-stranded-DNA-specific exonuclease
LLFDPSEQLWHLPAPLPPPPAPLAEALAASGLPPELAAVLRRRGVATPEMLTNLLDPAVAPEPHGHFADLNIALDRLTAACAGAEAVAICGDYDADGMTSTALLVGVLRQLGARPQAAIPSRSEDGYGLNTGMVERLAGAGVRLLVTVDNGVSAREALERAEALGVEVILTDHHTLPSELPPHHALLHPAVTPAGSPYRGLAGVGLAHVLASALCRRLGREDALTTAENLFCIGTIADMAPLLGVNRRWLMDGLPRLHRTRLPGLQALQQVAGVDEGPLDAATVAFQLAPRINAVGRLGDPQLVVELLTGDEPKRAGELARSCDALNRQRRDLCQAIEAEALALLEADGQHRPPFLLLAQAHWHHGVIGIVASRLVERFGQPVALLAAEGDGRFRASVRAPRGFAVDQALNHCADLLERHGGHPAAGGFSVRAECLVSLHERLNGLAGSWLGERSGGQVVEPEAQLRLDRIERSFWQQLCRLEPFGIGHPAPLFWCSHCRVAEARILRGGHLRLELQQGASRLGAIAWRWPADAPPQGVIDVAFRLGLNRWRGEESLQLEIVALRPGGSESILLRRRDRTYWCERQGNGLRVRNAAGHELQWQPESVGAAVDAVEDQEQHPYVRSLLQEAALALGLGC